MPFCETNNGERIFYRRYGHGSTKVLFIVGLACTHTAWGPQLKGLAGTDKPNEEGVSEGTDEEGQQGIEACCFDNRGMGRSSIPSKTSDYSTTIMAKDAVALLDHLGWKKAHVIGHSMGAMIACKLAAIAPDRLCSLALLNATGGGFECIPKLDRQMISLFYRLLRAKTPEQRADVDLETHYTKEYLDECIGTRTRRQVLYEQYVKGITSSGMQSNCGFEGQLKACWNHKLTAKELDTMRSSGFLISVIHGRYDIVAQLYYARRLAEKLRPAARMVEIHGGHLVSRERPDEVNEALLQLIQATNSNLKPEDWSNLPENSSGRCMLRMPISFSIRSNEGANSFVTFYTLLGKLQLGFLYFIGVFVMAFRYMMNAVKLMKPARVVATET